MVDGPEVKIFFFFFRVNVQAGHDCRWVAAYNHKLKKKAYDNIIATPTI